MYKILYLLLVNDYGKYESNFKLNDSVNFFVFTLATLILMVIMLNLIISFIGDSYEDVVSKKDSTFTNLRCRIIKNIEHSLSVDAKKKLDE